MSHFDVVSPAPRNYLYILCLRSSRVYVLLRIRAVPSWELPGLFYPLRSNCFFFCEFQLRS